MFLVIFHNNRFGKKGKENCMENDNLAISEYESLRNELLGYYTLVQNTIKTYSIFAATVFCIPIVLGKIVAAIAPDLLRSNQPSNVILNWSIVSTGGAWLITSFLSGVILFTMIQSVYWTIDGVRKIGAYIRIIIEPKSSNSLNWERAVSYVDSQLSFRKFFRWNYPWPGDEAISCVCAIVLYTTACIGAGFAFCPDNWYCPLIGALIPVLFSCIYIKKLLSWKSAEVQYTQAFEAFKAENKPT
jgi:hypothetical protein